MTTEETAKKTAKKAIDGAHIFTDKAKSPILEPRPIERRTSLERVLNQSIKFSLMIRNYTFRNLNLAITKKIYELKE